MKVLVTGGAGYIGSHTVAALLERGEQVVVYDHLETGHREAVPDSALFVEGDIRDVQKLEQTMKDYEVDAVIHFAAYSLVGESMQNPGKYYENNVYGTKCLLEAMVRQQVKRIVFSSTAAVYGEPVQIPIHEDDPIVPTNAYGETKLTMERMMRWYETAHGIHFISLRYFNAAGAHASGEIGEDHQPETHLIPLVLQTALGQRSHISIFGEDYPTEDGTCIRDYIHVSDLADAHILALDALRSQSRSGIYNLGNGQGFSVKQVIETAREVTGRDIPARMEDRRAGDPAVLVASSEKARNELGWKPSRTDLREVLASAWEWHVHHPQGYASPSLIRKGGESS
ncbi:UDP-glucose 4-epimerase GalE [Marinicrinis sediminis]|uniref:UDP-glucose 4-epimerase n=1 Tax=Marinicrinis sediminis TaxID=1652465 RepID=A0ABW5R5L6_9BACL